MQRKVQLFNDIFEFLIPCNDVVANLTYLVEDVDFPKKKVADQPSHFYLQQKLYWT